MPPECNFTSDSDRESIISVPEVIKSRRNSQGPKYFCSIAGCDKNFKRLDHLDRHEYHHTGIKKHACTYDGCDKTYSILTHLKRHLRTTHERTAPTEKNIPCAIDDCDKMFPSVCNMQRHVREVHENPKEYNCSFCAETFTQKLKMRRHEISKHTGEYPFSCGKCSKGFYQQWQYEKHLPTCKVYPCVSCGEQFDKWSNYLKHCKDMQHGRKYYKCEHCPRVYAKPGELKRHIVVKHMENEATALSFKCTEPGCERVYAYERNLRQHMKTAHSGKRFECEETGCERCFSSAQNLMKHLQRVHSKRKREESDSSTIDDATALNANTETKPLRKKRKDAGKTVLSNLTLLSGIAVEREFDKLLREREENALELASTELNQKFEAEESISEAESVQPVKLKACLNNINLTGNERKEKPSEENQLNSWLELALQD